MELTPLLATALALLVIIIFVMTVDDLFIDFWAFKKRLGPQPIDSNMLLQKQEKKIAIMIANWKEHDVIERMITGNNQSLIYSQHHFFLGVYPNDKETLSAVEQLEKKFTNVHAVVNSQEGPTSKGQMLNEIVTTIFSFEQTNQMEFDLFVIHDSEDILHPWSLKLMNSEADTYDYIQIPIFSLNRKSSDLTAGTYMDEFAEMHTKELLVRQSMGAAIPSAGVGTCLNRSLLKYIQKINNGLFLRPDSLTEDYILGWQAHLGKFRCAFVCKTILHLGIPQLIATKEYFPSHFWQSVRQKTRWTIGIAFQAKRILGWSPRIKDNYFLMRDRRGPLNSMVTLTSLVLLAITIVFTTINISQMDHWITFLAAINIIGLAIRYAQRLRFYSLVYGHRPVFLILVRWPIATMINAFAALRAFYQYYLSVFGIRKLRWSKTQHTLPEEFGQTA